MPQKKYRVVTEKGTFIVTTDEPIAQEAQLRPGGFETPAAGEIAGRSSMPVTPQVDPMDQVRRVQAAKYPTAAEQGGRQGAAVEMGVLGGFAEEGRRNLGKLFESIVNTAPGAQTMGYDSPENQWLGSGIPGGAGTAGMRLGEAFTQGPLPTAVRGAATALKVPERLLTGAAESRVRAAKPQPIQNIPLSIGQAAEGTIKTAMRPLRLAKANIQERVAKALAAGGPSSAGPVSTPPVMSPPIERPVTMVPPSQRGGASRFEPLPETPPVSYRPAPMDVPERPMTDVSFKADGPMDEVPMAQMPEGQVAPMNRGPEQIEQAMAPSGREARLGAERIAPELAQDPILAQVQKAKFNQTLFERYKLAGPKVKAAEQSIPRTTMVPQPKITDALEAIVDKYRDMGATEAAAAVAREWEKWGGKASQIPWDDYITMKRRLGDQMDVMGQFRESGNAAERAAGLAMKEAYRAVSEAGNVSDALRAANHEFWLTHSAMEDAGLSLRSGRKISEIGTAANPTMMDIAEQDLAERVRRAKNKP